MSRIVRPATAFSLTAGKQKRPRVKEGEYLTWIRTLPCLVTGARRDVEAAHIRYADHKRGKHETGAGEKPDDRWAVPLQWSIHRRQHTIDEERFWQQERIDPIEIALALYGCKFDTEAAETIIRSARPEYKPIKHSPDTLWDEK